MSATVPRKRVEYEPLVPWPAIMSAVNLLLNDANFHTMKGEGWSVYRSGNFIRIDITNFTQQGE